MDANIVVIVTLFTRVGYFTCLNDLDHSRSFQCGIFLQPCCFLLFRRQSQPVPKLAPPPNNQTPLERAEKDREKIKEPRESREKNNIRPKELRDREKLLKTREEKKEREKEKKASPPPPSKPEKRAALTERGKGKEEKRSAGQERKTERSAKPQPAKPPPKKRRKWLKEVPSSSESDSSASEDESEYTCVWNALMCSVCF